MIGQMPTTSTDTRRKISWSVGSESGACWGGDQKKTKRKNSRRKDQGIRTNNQGSWRFEIKTN